jgi:hypothetical protein
LSNDGGTAFTNANAVTFGAVTASSLLTIGNSAFGNDLVDTHVFTGSVWITSSLYITGTVTSSLGYFGTASYATTASYALNGGGGGGTTGITSQQVLALFIAYPSRMI